MNFKEYASSQLVNQGTLLKKFNKLIELLENVPELNSKIYRHQLTLNYGDDYYVLELYTSSKTKMTIDELSRLMSSINLVKFILCEIDHSSYYTLIGHSDGGGFDLYGDGEIDGEYIEVASADSLEDRVMEL